ncbi:alpha/beta hydrolase [Flavobacterium akiainvivens]|uniref:alpha/beta hydrolase n=1 Tax=Flavobacterium akiainvivens TaxID=1202724 RepID=UPI0006C873B0|nr:alpha/beta hydrolase [Flavobacterium akiainvivens]SFQ77517.1 Acetyl esterase/lipase [Flavobacterium akiainvivens]
MKVNKRIIQIAIAAILLVVLFNFIKHSIELDDFTPKKVTLKSRVFKNLAYKKITEFDSLMLDIYLPETIPQTKIPAVIFIHGGGWTDGSKDAIQTNYRQYVLKELLENGYAVFSIDYQLVNQSVHFPLPIVDCKDAVRWIRKNADYYHIDTTNVGIWGASAGGHLALLTAYSDDNDFIGNADLQPYSSKVNYVVDNFGPVDLNLLLKPETSNLSLKIFKVYSKEKYLKRQEKLIAITGVRDDKSKIAAICKQFSPINYISSESVPTLILHGNADETVPLAQSELLSKILKQNSVEHQLIIYENATHGFKNINQQAIDEVVKTTISFMNSRKSTVD